MIEKLLIGKPNPVDWNTARGIEPAEVPILTFPVLYMSPVVLPTPGPVHWASNDIGEINKKIGTRIFIILFN